MSPTSPAHLVFTLFVHNGIIGALGHYGFLLAWASTFAIDLLRIFFHSTPHSDGSAQRRLSLGVCIVLFSLLFCEIFCQTLLYGLDRRFIIWAFLNFYFCHQQSYEFCQHSTAFCLLMNLGIVACSRDEIS
ncbi:hypothetical protein BB8028_0001g05390 [Beauveria bassiana]|uniref:Uncharacterized protein n=1 Tax=Beauveria bassiana TaxID=176275 RepID=A0A2S7XX46_BEABA|nr:hypothetical protein BB8028_0001g05390 [Beauveria bassiana]